MKPTAAGVAVFSGLAAVVAADALPMDSIPIQCVKICGPVVELTSICNTSIGGNRQRLLRRRRQGDGAPPSIPNRHERLHHSRRKHEAAPIRKENGGKDLAEQEKRDFSIIRQAPTSFPPELLIPPETAAAAAPTRINPVIVSTKLPVQRPPQPQPPPTQDTDGDEDISDEDGEDAESTLGRPQPSAPPLPPPPPSSSSSRDKPSSATATEQRSASNTEAAESWPDKAGNGGDDWWNSEGAEQQCVCQNKSFDVGLITALCASCVDQSGDPTDNIDIIVTTCRFKSQDYDRSSDRAADGVRVRATKPTLDIGTAMGMDLQMSGDDESVATSPRMSLHAPVLAAGGALLVGGMMVLI